MLDEIAGTDVSAYRAMLSVPAFARSVSFGPDGARRNKQFRLRFIELNVLSGVEHTVTSSWLNGKLHAEDDKPAWLLSDGTQAWAKYGLTHRDGDKPAVIKGDGTQKWYQHGDLHRGDDKPAVIKADGTRKWVLNNQYCRRDDKPAIIDADGTQIWYQHDDGFCPWCYPVEDSRTRDGLWDYLSKGHGRIHRADDKPAVIYANGGQEWYQHGKLHRDDDKPAIIYSNGSQEWYQHGELHRANGLPAVIDANGVLEWWLDGEFLFGR